MERARVIHDTRTSVPAGEAKGCVGSPGGSSYKCCCRTSIQVKAHRHVCLTHRHALTRPRTSQMRSHDHVVIKGDDGGGRRFLEPAPGRRRGRKPPMPRISVRHLNTFLRELYKGLVHLGAALKRRTGSTSSKT